MGQVGSDDRFQRLARSPKSCHSGASSQPGRTSPNSVFRRVPILEAERLLADAMKSTIMIIDFLGAEFYLMSKKAIAVLCGLVAVTFGCLVVFNII